jgi:hypothetical protein
MPLTLARLILAAVLAMAFTTTAFAAPARIIILRHGEKANPWRLCEVGAARANALADSYLGAKATKSLFADGEEPAFFFAITLHTLELAAPSAASWSKPLILYSVVPDESDDDDLHVKALNRRTQEAAANIMQNPALNGKTIVMVWEHKHIANAKLDAKYEGEAVTLRKLLKLDILPGVPATWPGDNYDYFWIIDYDSGRLTNFQMLKQTFAAPYQNVPSNDWDTPAALPKDCEGSTDPM